MNKSSDPIYNSTTKLLIPSTPIETYKTVTKEAIEIMGAKYGTLYLGDKDKINRVYSTLPSRMWIEPRPKGNTYKTYLSGKVRIVEKRKLLNVHKTIDLEIQSVIFLPLFLINQLPVL